MNYRSIITIAYKVLALYGIFISLSALNSVMVYVSSYSSGGRPESFPLWVILTPYFLQLAFVVLLWFSAGKVDENTETVSLGNNFDFQQLYTLAFTVLGMYIFIDSLSSLTYQLINSWVMKPYYYGQRVGTQQYVSFVIPVLKLLLSLVLIIQAKGITGIIDKLRQTPKP
jgi:DNA helicase HerA-like ATPase